MSDDSNETYDAQDPIDESAAPGEDLTAALASEGEISFVAEERKSINRTTLVMFAVLLAGAGGLYFMHLRSGPRAAQAADATAVAAQQTIDKFLGDGGGSIRAMETMLRDTEKVVQQFLSYPSMTQVPLESLRTNPFRFRAAGPATPSRSTEAAEKQRREQEKQEAIAAVKRLQLQSILHSADRRACVIDRQFYSEGQQVNGFSIEKINPQSVVVRKDRWRFELKMAR